MRTPLRFPLLVLPLILAAGCVVEPAAHEQHAADATPAPQPSMSPAAPYAGQEMREIKALSAEEIEGYRSGAGLGYAKPAELNSYPGPLHALEMRDRLQLSPEQVEAITAIRADMLAKARPLGERYLILEGAIEQGFRDGNVSADALRALLRESSETESELRFVHLEAHLTTRALMSQHQVALYDEARGYGAAQHDTHAHG